MPTRRRCLTICGCLTITAIAACDVDAPAAPAFDTGLVVFAVLDPAASEQTVLLMRSRAAVADTTSRPVSADDPIVSAGETPITDARVVLYGPAGDSAVAIEDRVRRADRLGAGVYRISSSATASTLPAGAYLAVTPGGRYTLRVTSASLGTAEGTTRVPLAERNFSTAPRTVSLSRDSVLLGSGAVQAAGFVYTLRTANGNGVEGDPQFRRDLERRLVLPSGNDAAFAYARERLRAGTRHVLTVTAVDSSYFGYYGAEGDPFADRTLRTTLRGASGVFGSVLLLYATTVTITN